MAHHIDQVGFPAIPLNGGMIIKLEARNTATDAEVAGVTSAQWMIYGYDESPGPLGEDVVPLLTPEEVYEGGGT